MISFSQFILEAEILPDANGIHRHDQDIIAGQHVALHSVQSKVRDKKNISISFDVNGHVAGKARGVTPKQGVKIYSKIAHHISNMIDAEKPHSVSFIAARPALENAYEAFGKHLARKHGGVYKKEGHVHRVVLKKSLINRILGR